MSKAKWKYEAGTRAALLIVFLVYSLVPVSASAQPVSAGDQTSAEDLPGDQIVQEESLLSEQTPLYYQPPQSGEEQVVGPPSEGDEPPSPIPPKDEVEFSSVTELVTENTIKVSVAIVNHSSEALQDLVFRDQLESGFSYQSNVSSPASYDSTLNEVNLELGQLSTEESYSFEYFIEISSSKRTAISGKTWIRTVILSGNNNLVLTAPMTIALDVPAASSDESSVVAILPDEWNDAGTVKVFLDSETIGQGGVLVVNPVEAVTVGPKLQFELNVFNASQIAENANGELNEQVVTLGQEHTGNFEGSAFIEINLDGYIDLSAVPAGLEPYVVTYDEATGIWVKVPILETDVTTNTVTVEVAHFSTWGAGLGNSLPQNGANVLLFDQPYTSLFTGASRYSIPIWAPPGRAGMSPDVSLSYSSATVDGVLGDVQAPWTGVGWNIDGIEIVRKITTNSNGYGYVNQFALTLNGAVYNLVEDSVHPKKYYTSHDAFLYIERHNYASPSNAEADGEFPDNTTGEWWEVVTTDGTHYRLGWNDNSEQLALMYGYACTTDGISCLTPNGAYASLGYAGIATDLVALRWRVDRVMDPHGNYMEYTYSEVQPSGSSTIAPFDRESYLDTISYTGFQDTVYPSNNLDPAHYIHFAYDERSKVGDVPNTFNIWDNRDTKLLDKIEVCYLACTGDGVVRTYALGYSLAPVPNANGTLTLTSIATTGGEFTQSGQYVSPAAAPTILLSYDNMDNRAVTGSNDKYTYPRLASIDNGAGGLLTYTYETDGRGTNSWYDYRVKQVQVESGLGAAALQSYTYTTPVYAGSGGDPSLGELIGYTTSTENQLNYASGDAVILSTAHTFGTTGLDTGRELKTEWLNGSTVYRRVTNGYGTDNSKAPFFGWNFRYLYSTSSYELSGGNLVLTSKIITTRDAATGNPLMKMEYLGTSILRKTFYEYLTNPSPQVYILDKVSRALLVNGSNQILGDIRYHYDGKINDGTIVNGELDAAPKHGDLTLIQRLTGAGNQTVDSKTNYDIYGNVTSVEAIPNYGTVNHAPTGASYVSSTIYDPGLKTYPIQSTNALGQSSSTDYILALGIPYRVTDPNGWVTSTTYDGLGRTLSVTAPGLTEPGVYYAYPHVNGGQIIAPYAVEMQILDTPADQYRSVWGIYDGLGRMIQTQVYDADTSKTLVSDSYYNAQGLVYQQTLPYPLSSDGGYYLTPSPSAAHTDSTFDNLGRVLTVTQPGNITGSTSYDGLTTTLTDPDHNKTTRTTDGLGRLVNVKEYSDVVTLYAATFYTYDAGDHLINVYDAKGNETNLQYDWLGRKTGMEDPDMGEWTYEYYALGYLKQQMDARGAVLNFNYDELGRLRTKSGSGVDTEFKYGTTPGGGTDAGDIGMRVEMTDAVGTTTWSYSNFGRSMTEDRIIAGQPETLTTTSDWLGRPLTVKYPGNETVTYEYDALGRPDKMSTDLGTETTQKLVDLAYNALGQITSQTLGNNLITITNTYETNTNRLDTRVATGDLINFDYAYDAAGNITTITDATLTETQAFHYDFLNRLTSAEAFSGATQKYGQQYSYDQVGNITQLNNWITPTPMGFMPGSYANSVEDSAIVPVSYFIPKGENAPNTGALANLRADAHFAPRLDPATDTPTQTSTQTSTPTPSDTPTLTPTPLYSLTLQPSGANGIDTYLLSTSPTSNFETSADMGVGESNDATNKYTRSLIKFDLSALPGNATITSATLSLWTSQDLSSNTANISIYRLKVPFSETQATWNVSASGAIWQSPGASGASDRETTAIGTLEMSASESINAEIRIELTPALIEELANHDFTNNGFIIVADTELNNRFNYKTSDSITASQRPKLVIEYTLSGITPSATLTPSSTASLTGTPTNTTTPATSTRTRTNTPVANTPITATKTATPTATYWSGVDAYTVSMLHMNGADTYTTFTDEAGKTWTTNGHVQIDTAKSKFGGASGIFDGSGDYISSANHSDFNIGSGDFTIDYWVRFNALPGTNGFTTIASTGKYGTGPYYGWELAVRDTSGQKSLYFCFYDIYGNVQKDATYNVSLSTNTWYHMAVVRSGNSVYLALDGNLSTAANWAGVTGTPSTRALWIGYNARNDFNGWLDEFRISKGIARWTSNFAPPPTAPYGAGPTLTSTVTYTPSTTPTPSKTSTPTRTPTPITFTHTPSKTLTVTKTPTITPELGNLLAYWNFESATTASAPDDALGDVTPNDATLTNGPIIETTGPNGKLIFFDGSNDYATVGDQSEIKNNGSFTISAWIDPAAIVTDRTQYIVQKGGTNKDYGLITVSTQGTATPTANPNPENSNANGSIAFQVGDLTPNTVIGPILPVNSWTLVTGVYDSSANQLRLYINGDLVASQTVTGTVSMGTNPLTFSSSSAANVYSGRLDEVRFYNRALTDAEVDGLPDVPTPTPTLTRTATTTGLASTATSLPVIAQPWGTGDDGDLSVSSGVTVNLNTYKSPGRNCADAAAFNVTLLGSTTASLATVVNPTATPTPTSTTTPTTLPNSGCLNPGDEVMLIQLTDSGANNYNAGSYEFLRVASVSGSTVNFTSSKHNWYGAGWHSDGNIGVSSGQYRVMLIRVPNYDNVTVGGTLTANAWNYSKFGVVPFRVNGSLTGSGVISANALGFHGGTYGGTYAGEGYGAGTAEPPEPTVMRFRVAGADTEPTDIPRGSQEAEPAVRLMGT